MCTVSILHLMFISIDRFRGIRKPFHNRNKYSVLYRIIMTWLIGLVLAFPIPVLFLVDKRNVMPAEGVCQINNEYFVIFGSLFSFYLPMVIIVTMYVLTVHQLKNPKVRSIAGQSHVGVTSLAVNTLNACPGTPTIEISELSFLTPVPIASSQFTYK